MMSYHLMNGEQLKVILNSTFKQLEAKQARQVLDVNKSERHIRGGLATREKYRHMA